MIPAPPTIVIPVPLYNDGGWDCFLSDCSNVAPKLGKDNLKKGLKFGKKRNNKLKNN